MAVKQLDGGVTITSRRMFADGGIHILETMDGNFVYLNGKIVDKLADLNILPEQHRIRAIEWFEKRMKQSEQEKIARQEIESKAKADAELLDFLRKNRELIESVHDQSKEGLSQIEKDKRGPGRPKKTSGDEALDKMGLQA